MKKRGIWMVLVVLALMMLTNCKTREAKIDFETLVKGGTELLGAQDTNLAATYEEMDLMIAANATEAQQIADTLFSEGPGMRSEKVANVDYGKYLVIFADFGVKPSNGFVITIEEISQTGRSINVVIDTVESYGGDAIVTHPVHVVKVKKSDLLLKGRLSFILWGGDEVILTREHFVQ